MAFWSNLLSTLFGGGGGKSVAETVGEQYDKAHFTDQEKSADDVQDLASAREYQPDNMLVRQIQQKGLIPFFLEWLLHLLNSLVDAVNHLIRPGAFVLLLGGIMGWWKLPDPSSIDPEVKSWFTIILTFWFGGRTIVRDMPAMLKALAELRKK